MQSLTNKRVLVGISGGIAAYKSAELVRRLRDQGAVVRVVMTWAATEFITPLTLQAVSANPVATELLDHNAEAAMGHIELARWADCIVIAPATANCMARLCWGMADDLLTTLCLAADVPLLLAPAMNQQMWANPATQHNAGLLQSRGVHLLGPATGDQACGDVGPGRMLEPDQIVAAVTNLFRNSVLNGIGVMITAGPTREALDPVRYLSNHSSGRMGFALARAAAESGAAVTLVAGPVNLEPPDEVRYIPVTTARQMHNAVMQELGETDIFISAAAVADYRCSQSSDQKIKKNSETLTIQLEKNPDILREVAATENSPFTVGFAAETEELEQHARAKLQDKQLNLIAANLVGEGLAFDQEENALEVFWPQGQQSLALAPKEKLARQLLVLVAEQYFNNQDNYIH